MRWQLQDVDNAADAYRRLCSYVDHQSEARERGDLTEDRDEWLALGAGWHFKQRIWRWITDKVIADDA